MQHTDGEPWEIHYADNMTFRISFFLLASLIFTTPGYAQQKHIDIRQRITEIILPEDGSYLEKETFTNGTITFSYAIATDARGRIDTIAFSNSVLAKHIAFLKFDSVRLDLKRSATLFKKYKNTIFIGMCLIANGDLDYIDPKQLYSSWPKLFENFQQLIGSRKLVLINPVFKTFHFKKLH